jgi:hypothetical protein
MPLGAWSLLSRNRPRHREGNKGIQAVLGTVFTKSMAIFVGYRRTRRLDLVTLACARVSRRVARVSSSRAISSRTAIAFSSLMPSLNRRYRLAFLRKASGLSSAPT